MLLHSRAFEYGTCAQKRLPSGTQVLWEWAVGQGGGVMERTATVMIGLVKSASCSEGAGQRAGSSSSVCGIWHVRG